MKNLFSFNEKILYDIDEDVNLIYSYFKNEIDKIKETGIVKSDYFKITVITTSDLVSEKSRLAHSKNPCYITLNNNKGNYYQPSTNEYSKSDISISVNPNAIDYVIEDHNGDIVSASKIYPIIKEEFKEYKIKGSIRHELAHWIDDTTNNYHISKKLFKTGIRNYLDKKGYNNVNISNFEIYSIMQNIYELKMEYKDEWNKLTFIEMLQKNPVLNNIYRTLDKKDFEFWKKTIKRKMYKEGILGKNMKNL